MEDDPAYDISVNDANGGVVRCEALLRAALESTLHRHGCGHARIAVVLVTDSRIAELNRQHLRHDGPTDVLAFDLSDEEVRMDNPRTTVEGDIIISAETAARQATERGHPPDDETALYAVHGALHLLGYNDDTPEEAATMHAMEDAILTDVGLGNVYGADT